MLQKRDDFGEWLFNTTLTINQAINNERDVTTRHIIQEAKQYIMDNYQNPDLSVEMICRHLHMSPAYFSTIFKKETGQSLSQSLQAYRLKKAYLLLTTTHLKIYEIAEQCGYNSSQYFSMVFTKYYQCSPSDVMNQSGGDCDELER